jgi:hypothetical protein
MAWACAVLGKFPVKLMNILYTGQFMAGTLQNASYLTSIYGDGGLSAKVGKYQLHIVLSGH